MTWCRIGVKPLLKPMLTRSTDAYTLYAALGGEELNMLNKISKSLITLVSRIVEHIEISEHLAKFAEKLLVEHLFYTISIATNQGSTLRVVRSSNPT